MKYSSNSVLHAKAKAFVEKYKSLSNQSLSLDEYNANYLKKYLKKTEYNTYLACQLIDGLDIKKFENVIDIGGGIGFNAAFFQFIGFENVIYFDVDPISTKDAKQINTALGITQIDYYSDGYEGLIKFDLSNSLVCSRDVIEHIYDLPSFFEITKPAKLNRHNTAAVYNSYFRSSEFKAIHHRAENEGQITKTKKQRDSKASYLALRTEIIQNLLKDKIPEDLRLAAVRTRGLTKLDIEKYLDSGVLPKHHTITLHSNTCDPITGNWAERTLPFKDYKLLAGNTPLSFKLLRYNTFNGNILKKMTLGFLNLLLIRTKSQRLCPSFTIQY